MTEKKLRLQHFGTIEMDGGTAKAMLCIDVDRPDEVVIHWWGDGITPSVVLARCRGSGDESLELEPLSVSHVNANGGFGLAAGMSEKSPMPGLQLTLQRQSEKLEGEWRDESGRKGRVAFQPAADASAVNPEKCADWAGFKEWATRSRSESDAVAYRGHGSSCFRLQTSLHRAGRHRLERYCRETLTQFRDHAEAVLGMRFNLEDGDDFAILLGLAQHHGLPTPLLDWSSSPYIAAFFAFADAIDFGDRHPDASYVRVYGLTRDFVGATSPGVVELPRVQPYVASLSISPRNNPRLYAQQGLFLVTNVADVEGFICQMEQESGRKALIAADVPVDCASEALEDLAFMGLTAASLYPGLDGVCRMMRHAMLFKHGAMLPAGKPAGGMA